MCFIEVSDLSKTALLHNFVFFLEEQSSPHKPYSQIPQASHCISVPQTMIIIMKE